MNVYQIAVHDYHSKTIWDHFVLSDTYRILEFSVLMAFHTLSLLYFPLLHFPPLLSTLAFLGPLLHYVVSGETLKCNNYFFSHILYYCSTILQPLASIIYLVYPANLPSWLYVLLIFIFFIYLIIFLMVIIWAKSSQELRNGSAPNFQV